MKVAKVALTVVVLILCAAGMGVVGWAGVAANGAGQSGHATPSPTPCQVVYVADDGRESCYAIPTYGIEPFP